MNFKKNLLRFCCLLAVFVVASCSDEDCNLAHLEALQGLPALKEGTFPEEDITLNVGEEYVYAPTVSSTSDVHYQWFMNGENVSTDESYTLKADRSMRSMVKLELTNEYGKVTLENKVYVPGADYTKGCFILNEGWFGHETGSISFWNYETNSVEHWCYKNQNYGDLLGVTSQSATLWNGKLYVCSKDDNQLTVIDPQTLYAEKSCGKLFSNYQAYEFVGLNDKYGLITQGAYFSRIDLNTYETITLMSVGDTWAGTGSGIVYNGKLLLNVKKARTDAKIYSIDVDELTSDGLTATASLPYKRLDIATDGGVRFVECNDGNLYTIESTPEGIHNLVQITPDFTINKKEIRSDYLPSDFGAYREATFCGTPEGTFYYVAGGKIYKATWDNPAPEQPFTSYTKDGYSLYGAGIRVNPQTHELLASYLSGDYFNNHLVRFNAETGEAISEVSYEGYYFPATFIFN